MAEVKTLHDAFLDGLRDAYDAEKQLTKALAKMAEAACSPELKAAFESHLEESRGYLTRLEELFESLDETAKGKHGDGIAVGADESMEGRGPEPGTRPSY